MADNQMVCTGISPEGQPIGKFAGLFPCPYCIQIMPENLHTTQVLAKAERWLRIALGCSVQTYMNLTLHERLPIFQRYSEAVTPELINVIHADAFWRLPYAPGPGEHRYITEGVAILMAVLDGRFKWVAFGAEQNRGDIFMSGPLSQMERFDLEIGRFPSTLALYGRPGPGVCGRPAERR